ncbi:TetR/AcrR family transcriptional regulator [Actinomadura sp. WMMA1423]|uniref:TetR/AcrR family transcriptional regulator n=1 Tax=Actinomadura sp. WMMA1423 TaxID=2591108 RepID=UPI0011470F45|nr:TetR/AcrR family transcriptional regulator [Actinomadura sp. WMMA1423]
MAEETVRGRAYGGQSADQRRAGRRLRLVDAALTSMADGTWRAETVARLCGRAELNKRYFYESFTDLDQLAVAAIDQVSQEVGQAALDAYAAAAGRTLADQAHAAIGAVVHTLADDPRKARVLFGTAGGPPLIQQHRTAAVQGLTGILMDHARAIHGVELTTDTLARTAPPFVVGGTAETILAWVNGTVAVPLDALIDDLATLWLITGNGAAAHARHRVRNP